MEVNTMSSLTVKQMCVCLCAHRCAVKIYPKDLPSISVILIYLNEALSIIKRAIRSIIDKTPAHLLTEIILVDDYSLNGSFLFI